MPARPLLTIAATALVLFPAAVLTACSGSHRSPKADFATATRAICKTYKAQELAISRRVEKETSIASSQRNTRASFRATDKWLSQLRELSPPTSSGVTVREWRKAIEAQRRLARAFDSFFAKEYPKLLRSFRKPPATPKLPPGTGPTAATLAQAFNSPEGRRYLRLQAGLFKRMRADSAVWLPIARQVGLLRTCGADGAGVGPSATNISTTTSTHP